MNDQILVPNIIMEKLNLLTAFRNNLMENRQNYYFSAPANPNWSPENIQWIANHFELNLENEFEAIVASILIGAYDACTNDLALMNINKAISKGWLTNLASLTGDIQRLNTITNTIQDQLIVIQAQNADILLRLGAGGGGRGRGRGRGH